MLLKLKRTEFTLDLYISLPPANEVWGKVICLQASVCPQGGVPDQVGTPPRTRYTPRDQVHLRSRHPPRTRYTPQSRHPLSRHPPGPGTAPGADIPRTRYTPRRRACWEIRSMRGRSASYWNAILFNDDCTSARLKRVKVLLHQAKAKAKGRSLQDGFLSRVHTQRQHQRQR